MKKYDALYIFVNVVKEDAIEPLLEKAGEEITRLGGKIIGSEMLGKKAFARPMNKKESGVYLRVRFSLSPEKVAELRDRYRLAEEVFRVQILAVDDRREAIVVEQNARRAERAAQSSDNSADDEYEDEA